jgi:spermidine synthase
MKNRSASLRFYLGIGIISLATLLFEVSLTRIFSISQWYHFAFMVVSIALLGYGASGSFLMLIRSRLKGNNLNILRITALLFSFSTIICYSIVNRIPFDPMKLAWDKYQILRIFGYYFFLGIPFFFAGLTISIAFTYRSEVAGKIYFADLTGAGLGGLGALAVFAPFAASGAVIITALLGAVASLCFSFSRERKFVIIVLCLMAALLVLLSVQPAFIKINISPYKGLMLALKYPQSELLQTDWNAFSRVDVVKSPLVRFAPGLSLNYLENLPSQIGITIDGDNLNAITKFSGKKKELEFTAFLPASLPFYVGDNDRVLIVEPMGGLDILSALYHKCKRIDAVELNPLIFRLVKDTYGDFAGHIYSKRKVNISIGESRAILRRSDQRYDVILLSPADVLGASSSGIYGLHENYLFTRESFMNFYHYLEKDGIFCLTLYLLPPPRQELKAISLIVNALEDLKVGNPEKHLVVMRSWGTFTILMKKSPFNLEEISKIKTFCDNRIFDLVYYDGINIEEVNKYNQFPQPIYYQAVSKIVDKNQRKKFYEEYLYDVAPVTDDKPFFYHFFRLKKLSGIYHSVGGKWQPFVQGDYLIFVIFIQALIASTIFIVLPLLFRKKKINTRSNSYKGRNFLLLLYFLFIGLGFMFIEISMIQKFILVLVHPVYSMSIVLVGLLIFSGLGSLSTARFSLPLKTIIIILAAIVTAYAILMPFLSDFIISRSAAMRGFFTLLLLLPLGFFMGMCFPKGIRLLSGCVPEIIPWAWCVNGCASVISSILAVIIALAIGFRLVLLCAGISYLASLLCISICDVKFGRDFKIDVTA